MLFRFSIGCIANLLACTALLAADEPATKTGEGEKPAAKATDSAASNTTASLADQLETISEAATADSKELMNAQSQFMKVQREVTKSQDENKKKLLELINVNPNDPATMDAVMVYIEKLRGSVDSVMLEKISAAIMSSPKAADLCLKMTRPGLDADDQEKFLKQVAEKHQQEKVRGVAYFVLGSRCRVMAQQNSGNAERQAQSRTESENYAEKTSQNLIDAEKYLTKVKTDFPSAAEVAYLKSTVGEKLESELNRIHAMPNLQVGKMAPEIESVDIDGQPMKLSDSRGKVTVLIFWGSWCGPCMGLVPHEKELFERMKGKPFAMVSVDCGDTRDKAQETRKTKGMDWRCWWDGGTTDGPIQAIYSVPHYPRIFVIDAKGIIRNIDVRHEDLDAAVDKLIEETSSSKMARR